MSFYHFTCEHEKRELSAGGKNVVAAGRGKPNGDYATLTFCSGTVYVMNENGKTAAIYDLQRAASGEGHQEDQPKTCGALNGSI